MSLHLVYNAFSLLLIGVHKVSFRTKSIPLYHCNGLFSQMSSPSSCSFRKRPFNSFLTVMRCCKQSSHRWHSLSWCLVPGTNDNCWRSNVMGGRKVFFFFVDTLYISQNLTRKQSFPEVKLSQLIFHTKIPFLPSDLKKNHKTESVFWYETIISVWLKMTFHTRPYHYLYGKIN